jgi:hypothetical protein
MPTFDPTDLIGRTFLKDVDINGEIHRVRVQRPVIEIDADGNEALNYLCKNDYNSSEEIIAYNEILDYIEKNCVAEENGERVCDSKRSLVMKVPFIPAILDTKDLCGTCCLIGKQVKSLLNP